MNKISGFISINTESKTITIHLENGAHCTENFPQGIRIFLEEQIENHTGHTFPF